MTSLESLLLLPRLFNMFPWSFLNMSIIGFLPYVINTISSLGQKLAAQFQKFFFFEFWIWRPEKRNKKVTVKMLHFLFYRFLSIITNYKCCVIICMSEHISKHISSLSGVAPLLKTPFRWMLHKIYRNKFSDLFVIYDVIITFSYIPRTIPQTWLNGFLTIRRCNPPGRRT